MKERKKEKKEGRKEGRKEETDRERGERERETERERERDTDRDRDRERERQRQRERGREGGRQRARDCLIWMAAALDGLSKSAVKERPLLCLFTEKSRGHAGPMFGLPVSTSSSSIAISGSDRAGRTARELNQMFPDEPEFHLQYKEG